MSLFNLMGSLKNSPEKLEPFSEIPDKQKEKKKKKAEGIFLRVLQ